MDLKAEGVELRATIHVTRKDTGKVETYELIGCTDPGKLPALLEAHRQHGSAGAMIGEGAIMNKPQE